MVLYALFVYAMIVGQSAALVLSRRMPFILQMPSTADDQGFHSHTISSTLKGRLVESAQRIRAELGGDVISSNNSTRMFAREKITVPFSQPVPPSTRLLETSESMRALVLEVRESKASRMDVQHDSTVEGLEYVFSSEQIVDCRQAYENSLQQIGFFPLRWAIRNYAEYAYETAELHTLTRGLSAQADAHKALFLAAAATLANALITQGSVREQLLAVVDQTYVKAVAGYRNSSGYTDRLERAFLSSTIKIRDLMLQELISTGNIDIEAIIARISTVLTAGPISIESPNVPSTNKSDVFAQLESLIAESNDDLRYGSTAEVMIRDYFDAESRTEGEVISRAGAGQLQSELLRGLLVVQNVKFSQGAVIFEGRNDRNINTAHLARMLEERLRNSPMKTEVDFLLVAQQRLPTMNEDAEAVALEALVTGTCPAVVFYPRNWNSTLAMSQRSPWKHLYRRLLSSAALATSVLFAADATGAFQPGSPFLTHGTIPSDLVPVVLTNAVIQNAGVLVEKTVGWFHGVRVQHSALPSFSQAVSNFGQRSTYLTQPQNRQQLFDIAVSGVVTTLTLSAAAIYAGLQLTTHLPTDVGSTLPIVSVALLQVNTILSQVFAPLQSVLVGSAHTLTAPLAPAGVHLHWLAIAGISAFIATTLQLIPINNSAGRKLALAALGPDSATVLNYALGLAKALFFVLVLFDLGGVATGVGVNKPRLLLDYFVMSQLLVDEKEVQISKDNLMDVGPERRAIFTLLMGLLVLSFLPYHTLVTSWSSNIAGVIAALNPSGTV